MARAHYIKQARKPNPVVTREDIDRAKAGEAGAASYWKWAFRYGGTYYSKRQPRPSQLTQSEYLGAVYALQEEIEDAAPDDADDLAHLQEDWASRANEIAEDTQEKLYNMPEGLQEGPTGELLAERVEAMEAWAAELEAVDTDYDPESGEDEGAWVDERLTELQGIEPDVA